MFLCLALASGFETNVFCVNLGPEAHCIDVICSKKKKKKSHKNHLKSDPRTFWVSRCWYFDFSSDLMCIRIFYFIIFYEFFYNFTTAIFILKFIYHFEFSILLI